MHNKKFSRGTKRQPGRSLGKFLFGNDGYAFTFTLIALPFLVAISAWIIDASRVTNLHTDLQNGVDSMALAGARELDGRNDAISRAEDAVAAIANNEAWFGGGSGGPGGKSFVSFDPNDASASSVDVHFLGAIPASDDTPILIGGNACQGVAPLVANDDCTVKGATEAIRSNNARYVWVVAKNMTVNGIFPIGSIGPASVAVNAQAVATYTAAACDVTPIYVCNPFESNIDEGVEQNPLYDGDTFNQHFEDGDLYGRQFTMRNTGNSSPAPGNFGFLRTEGNGANVLAHALATGSPGVCYSQDGLDTEPGANVGPVEQGLNVRVGLYAGSFGGYDDQYEYRPDVNIRKGQDQTLNNNHICSKYEPEEDPLDGMPFPTGANITVIGGGNVSDNNWDLDTYWDITHGGHENADPKPADDPNYAAPPAPAAVVNFKPSLPGSATIAPPVPSRYDAYTYEIQNNMIDNTGPNGESGNQTATACYGGATAPVAADERRVIFAAVLNCVELAESGELQGASTDLPAEAFARMFMTKPVTTDGNDKEIYLEMIDVSGQGGLGTLENFLREEAELVR
ncbi:MAG: TadE/TadG family type IV pilus assembly protein [Rhizobiaceae bacterium]